MRGIVFNAPGDVSVETVPDPAIADPGDAVVRVTMAGVCGSDMHIYNHGDAFGFHPGCGSATSSSAWSRRSAPR